MGNENVPATTAEHEPLGTAKGLESLLMRREDRLKAALENTGISPQRFIAGAVQAVARNPRLASCTAGSVLAACLEAAQMGLEPTGLLNEAWLVPYTMYRNTAQQRDEARLMVGYRGYIILLSRSGQYDFIEANLVYEKDTFRWEKGTDPHILHRPAAKERGKIVGAYWVAWQRGSSRPQFDVMSLADLDKRRKASKRPDEDFWLKWPEEMYRKTVLRWGMKSMPMTPVIRQLMAYEDESEAVAERGPTMEVLSAERAATIARLAGRDVPPEPTERPGEPVVVTEVSSAPNDSDEPEEAAGDAPGEEWDDGLPPLR